MNTYREAVVRKMYLESFYFVVKVANFTILGYLKLARSGMESQQGDPAQFIPGARNAKGVAIWDITLAKVEESTI